MRISFDVDDTLVVHSKDAEVEVEGIPRLFRGGYTERIRKGSRHLFESLEERGWEIAVYTTSDRSPFYLKTFLGFYGENINLVVNQARHEQVVVPRFRAQNRKAPTKHPVMFGIDLHVDDSEGVGIEGDRHVVLKLFHLDALLDELRAVKPYRRK